MANARQGVIIGMAAALTASSPSSLSAQSSPYASEGKQERTTLLATQNAMAGVRIYRTKGCRGCHGSRTGFPEGLDLRSLQTARSIYELAAAMWNHLPGMRNAVANEEDAPAPMSSRQAGDLIAFLFARGYFDGPGDPERGKRLFEQKQCVICHQLRGRGGVIGPRLDFFSRSSPIQLAAGLWNHAPGMAEAMYRTRVSRPTLSGPELGALASYLTSNSRNSESVLNVLPGKFDEGKRLFVQKGCVDCHGVAGTGGRVGPDLTDGGLDRSLLGFAAAMWNKAPAMIQAARTKGLAVPKLDGSEMAHLLAYLDSITYLAPAGDPDRGRQWVAKKGCLDCHSLNGTGGSMAGDLADADHVDSPAAFISALWNHLTVQRDPERSRTDTWPQLTPQEASDIAAYFRH